MKTFFILGLFALCAPVMALELSLSGVVQDSHKKPIPYAQVRVQGLEFDAFTDANGRWSLNEGNSQATFPRRLKDWAKTSFTFSQGKVGFQSAVPQYVYTKMFNDKGHQLSFKANRMKEGDNQFDPFTSGLVDGTYLLSVVAEEGYRGAQFITLRGGKAELVKPEDTLPDFLRISHPRYVTAYQPTGHSGSHTTILTPRPAANTFYVDAMHGQDTRSGTRQSESVKSLSTLKGKVKAGDTIVLASGQYGHLMQDTIGAFTDWVTLKAAPDAEVHIKRAELSAPRPGGWSGVGPLSMHLQFEGITFDDGFSVFGTRDVRILNCVINREGNHIKDRKAIGKSGMHVRNGADVLIQDTEITDTPIGFWVSASRNLVFRNNHVHHVAHDLLQITGVHGILIEGNEIHNADDNSTDKENKPWNMHADGMHVYPIFGGPDPGMWIADMTFRGNKVYDCESLSVMMQGKTHGQLKRYVFENNIFGPAGGFMFHCWAHVEGFIFRHNSVIHVPGGRTFKGLYRTLTNHNTWVKLPGFAKDPTNMQAYNNILMGGLILHEIEPDLYSTNNLYYLSNGKFHQGGALREMRKGDLLIKENPFKDPNSLTGELKPNSPAIDAGAKPFIGLDQRRNPRDDKVDIGAIELQKVD